MSRIVDELREKRKAGKASGRSPFNLTRLDWCFAVEWRYSELDLEQLDGAPADLEQMFLLITGAVAYYDIKFTLTPNKQHANVQVSLTQPPQGKRKQPTIVNIRARDAETALRLADLFLSAYLDKDWYNLPNDHSA